MILERLLDFHDRHDEIVPASLKPQSVRWFLEIGEDGRFLAISETGKKKSDQVTLVAPYASRQGSKPPPYLMVDKPNYVLGHLPEAERLSPPKREEEAAKALDRHADYVALVKRCAKSANLPEVDAFVRFLDQGIDAAREEAARLSTGAKAAMRAGDLIAPRVGGRVLTDLPAVRRFWAEAQDSEADEKSQLIAECLVTGEVGPIARTHPVELPVGPNRLGLVSANENAFLSYGLQQSEVAPMSFKAARKYGEALRYLLLNERHHLRVGDVTWVYWTRDEAGDPLFALRSADPVDVEALLRSTGSGRSRQSADANAFFALAVSANTSRMIVRSWVTSTVAEVQENIGRFFSRMRLVDRDGQARYHRSTALAGSLVRDFKDLSPQVMPALLNTALWGQPLPISLLHAAVQRARAEREHVLTHPRAALIKLVLQSNPSSTARYSMTERLDPAQPHPAYQCGRLLALLDNVQAEAVGARATLVDRYYGAASATPAAVFGVLMRNAQNHLGKIRKSKGRLAHYFDQQIAQIAAQLGAGGFPRALTLEEQGVFALGFYQERNRPKKSDTASGETGGSDH